MTVIVDSGGANLASVLHALARLGQKAELSADPAQIARASRLILPGVGAAADAMERLRARDLVDPLRSFKGPLLGICLGMQLLFECSEEGSADCLGLIPGQIERLRPQGPRGEPLPVPHMGWNSLVPAAGRSSRLLDGIEPGAYFYFVHSYRAGPGRWVRATCDYGGEVPALVERDNLFGVQFHPERSGRAGARLLSNFLAV